FDRPEAGQCAFRARASRATRRPPAAPAAAQSDRALHYFAPTFARPCWLQIPSAGGDRADHESSYTPLVVMEPTEYGNRVNAALPPEAVESAAGAQELGADALRCRSGRTR